MSALRFLIACAVALIVAGPLQAAGAEKSARQMYEAALARERLLRATWDAGSRAAEGGAAPLPADEVKRARATVAAYEAMVGRYPSSGYCDNALWQAAALAEDLFGRTEQTGDRHAAIRLFLFLSREYPASPFAAKAADRAMRLQATAVPQAGRAAGGPGSRRTRSDLPARPSGRGAPSTRLDVAPPVAEDAPPPGASRAAAASPAPPAGPISVVRSITRTVLAEVVRVSIELDREVLFRQERVENPARLLFDLPSSTTVAALKDVNWNYQDDVVRHIRVGRHPNQTTRVVLDLDGVSRYTVVTLYNPYRILIDCERTVPPAGSRPSVLPAAPARPASPSATAVDRRSAVEIEPKKQIATPAPDVATTTPPAIEKKPSETAGNASSTRIETVEKPKSQPAPAGGGDDPEPGRKPSAKPAVPDKTTEKEHAAVNDRNRVSMARQLGLGVSRIVIDPGHGGRDPGAEGPSNSEAEIVLDIALRLEKALAKQPGIEVVLTRRTDVFVPLEQRTQIANREQADLFLSIHANASRNEAARGIECYYLNFASNPDAEAVAARENAASERTMNSLTDMVKAIALNNKLDESRDLAALVQQAMLRRLRATNKSLKNLGVKQAPFVVLIGAAMPSVLAEVSFVTNRREGQLLKTDLYRQRIADALADAVLRYKRGLKSANLPAEH